jgi:16S rRNA processing protein RimM
VPEPRSLVVVGRIGGAYGVTGQVRVNSATDPRDNIERYRPWFIGSEQRFREVEVLELRRHGQTHVARLAGVTDRNVAQTLAGQEVAVPRSVLPELDGPDEFYWQDLIGMKVEDSAGVRLGQVERLIETPAHDVLVVRDVDGETLIPFTDPFVLEVDLVQKRLRVAWQG